MARAEVKRALILDGHSTAALEALQSLGRAGIEVDVAAEADDCLAFHSRYCRERLKQPDARGTVAFHSWLAAVVARNCHRLVCPAIENSLVVLNALEPDSPLRSKAVLASADSVNVALNKQATWELAARLGIRVPRSKLIESLDEEELGVGYPVVLKPVRSMVTTSSGQVRVPVAIARDAAERRRHLESLLRFSPVQEQAYVHGVGMGVECLYEHGRMVWHFLHERIHELPLTGGGSTYRRSVAPLASAIWSTKRLLDALDWHGVAMVEFKREPHGELCLMEINPRLWGSLALAIDAGVDFPIGLWRLACHERVGPQPSWRVPYFSRNLPRDFDWLKENLRASRSDRLLLIRPRLRSAVELLRPLLMCESWDHFDIRDPGVLGRQVRAIVDDNLASVRRHLRRRRVRQHLRREHRRLTAGLRKDPRKSQPVVFVCHGNICRSAFAHRYALKALPALESASGGFHDATGRQTPHHVVQVASQLGVDLADWRSTRLEEEMIERAGLILVMDEDNYSMLLERFPTAAGRVTALGMFASAPSFPIEDPYTLDEAGTRRTLGNIRDSIDGLARALSEARR